MKNLLKTLVLAVMTLAILFTLASCEGGVGSIQDMLNPSEQTTPVETTPAETTPVETPEETTPQEHTHTIVVDEAVAPTCTKSGWTEGQHCSECEEILVPQEKVRALGHNMVTDAPIDPTCTESGLTEGLHCTRCELVVRGQEVIPALGHAWVDATCSDSKVCSVCGTVDGDALGHTWVDATCTAPKTCSVCGATQGEALGHTAGAAATCTTAQTCTVCNAELTAALGHTLSTHKAKDPTCTENGWNEFEECANCDYTTFEEIIALGHTVVIREAQAPTCTAEGWDTYGECLTCGFNNRVILPIIDHTLENGKCVNCGFTNKAVDLVCNSSSVLINGSSVYKVTLYAQIYGNMDITGVGLYDSNGNYYGTMYDDGMYSSNGDELSGDLVYTLIVSLQISSETEYTFVASTIGADALTSNYYTVTFINAISDEELDDMEELDDYIEQDVFGQQGFDELDENEQKEVVSNQLSKLEEENLIADGSIVYNSDNNTFTFQYESGALGAIAINGFGNTSEYTMNLDLVDINAEAINSEIDAIILWSFNQAWDDPTFRTNFYLDVVEDWVSLGVDATIDRTATVEDYKKLSQYEIIVISAHGTYYTYKTGFVYSSKLPSIVLTEYATKEKDALYADDLKMHRIGKISVQGGTMYTILPDFWSFYYGSSDLDGSFVFSESCEFAGAYNDVNTQMFDAILSASAESVIGFHNSVMAEYSRNLMHYYVSSLIAGYTTEEALEMAKDVYGENDSFPLRELFYGPTAYPVIRGNYSSVLMSSFLENGSFEDPTVLGGWEHSGDVRVLTQLGALSPQDEQKMAILTTGIGSGESQYLEATEGSILFQTFYVDSSNSLLSFSYNVVSEEPHEFVGSRYDDKFYAEIVAADGTKYVIASESVNKSVWTKVSGINFDGGDSTTYETGWKLCEYDISAFKGQYITLRFVTYDVGDSIYDTAALIDNVVVH